VKGRYGGKLRRRWRLWRAFWRLAAAKKRSSVLLTLKRDMGRKARRGYSRDTKLILPIEMEKEKGTKAEAVVADGLYDSGENRGQIHEERMKAYIPFRGERKWMEKFTYLPEEDQVVCAIGKIPQENGMLYYFSAQDCQKCSRLRKCVRQNQVRMTVWINDDYKQKRADDGEGRREALRIRKVVERKFGEAKKWHGPRSLSRKS
jgi:hypothetical protein